MEVVLSFVGEPLHQLHIGRGFKCAYHQSVVKLYPRFPDAKDIDPPATPYALSNQFLCSSRGIAVFHSTLTATARFIEIFQSEQSLLCPMFEHFPIFALRVRPSGRTSYGRTIADALPTVAPFFRRRRICSAPISMCRSSLSF